MKIIIQNPSRQENLHLYNALIQSEEYDIPADGTYYLNLDKQQLEHIIKLDTDKSLTFALESRRYKKLYFFTHEQAELIFKRYSAKYYAKRLSADVINEYRDYLSLDIEERYDTFQAFETLEEYISSVDMLDLLTASDNNEVKMLRANLGDLWLVHFNTQ